MAAPVNRTLISRGPAYVKYGNGIFYSKDDIVLDWAISTANVASSAFGDVFPYRTGLAPTLTVPLVGEIEHLDILFPFGSMIPGRSIFTATDTPLQIIPIDPSQPVTLFHSAAVTAEPELTLGVSGGVALGSTTFRFLPRLGADLTDDSAWYRTRPQEPGDAPSGFDPKLIRIQSYDIHWLSGGKFKLAVDADATPDFNYNVSHGDLETALNLLPDIDTAGGVSVTGDHRYGWRVTYNEPGAAMPSIIGDVISGMPEGSKVSVDVLIPGGADTQRVVEIRVTPWSWLPTESAVQVRTTPALSDQSADSVGVYDIMFSGTTATASFIPLNVSQDDLFAAANVQGPGAALGANISSAAHDLVITAPGLEVTLFGAVITKAGGVWSATKQRVSETEWTASRTLSGNVVSPLYTVTTGAPIAP